MLSLGELGRARLNKIHQTRHLLHGSTSPTDYEHITRPSYESLVARLRRGQDAGQLSTAVSAEPVADALRPPAPA